MAHVQFVDVRVPVSRGVHTLPVETRSGPFRPQCVRGEGLGAETRVERGAAGLTDVVLPPRALRIRVVGWTYAPRGRQRVRSHT